jgi:nicotinamide mononucleotide transporter
MGFFSGKLYADMSLQVYYLVISILGWYWWASRVIRHRKSGNSVNPEAVSLKVTRISLVNAIKVSAVFTLLFAVIRFILMRFTDSPVPVWDSFLTSLSIVATWMLARKLYEHWYLWIVVNAGSVLLFIIKGLYPTIILYVVYLIMSFIGLKEWKKSLSE